MVGLIRWGKKLPCANAGKVKHKRKWYARYELQDDYRLCHNCLRNLVKDVKIVYDPAKLGRLKHIGPGLVMGRKWRPREPFDKS